MPYFFIVPLFFLMMATLLTATLASVVVPRFRRRLPVAWRLLVWCTVTFFCSNALYTLGLLAFLEAVPDLDGHWLQVPAGLVGAMLLFVGPFASSLLGVLLGIGLALRGARKAEPGDTVAHAA